MAHACRLCMHACRSSAHESSSSMAKLNACNLQTRRQVANQRVSGLLDRSGNAARSTRDGLLVLHYTIAFGRRVGVQFCKRIGSIGYISITYVGFLHCLCSFVAWSMHLSPHTHHQHISSIHHSTAFCFGGGSVRFYAIRSSSSLRARDISKQQHHACAHHAHPLFI